MDPLQEYLIQQEYGARQYENQKKSLGYERSAEDIIGAGPSLSGVDNIEYPLLGIIPPGYKMVPWYVANDKFDEFVGGVIKISKQWNRPFARTLLHTLGKGIIIGGIYPQLYGGFSLSGLKKDIKKGVEQVKNMVHNPLDAGKEIVSYVNDILPIAKESAKNIVKNPLSAPVEFVDYVKKITPYAKKHSDAFDKRIRGKGFCCSNCKIGKKCSGGISSAILGDPIFQKKLAKQREAIEQMEVTKDELIEEYHDAVDDGDFDDADRLSQEIMTIEEIQEEIEDQIENEGMEVFNNISLEDQFDMIEDKIVQAYEDGDEDEIEALEKERYDIETLMGRVDYIPQNYNDVNDYIEIQDDIIQNNIFNKKIDDEIKRISAPRFHPEDYTTNANNLAIRPIDRQAQCPELDIPYEMIYSYINFVYPQLPEYVRITLTKNLYNSISK